MWLVLAIKTTATVSVFDRHIKLSAEGLAEGCCGYCMVFNKKTDAEKNAALNESDIIEIDYKNTDPDQCTKCK